MSKEKALKLSKYQGDLKSKLESKDVPAKHTTHPQSYRQFLERELDAVTKKIEILKQK